MSQHKNVNINAIGKANSGTIVTTLSKDLAMEIIKTKEIGGDYKDFKDLEKRIYGLGNNNNNYIIVSKRSRKNK